MAVDEGDDEGHDDSQFFNMASKALKRLNSRKSTSIPENNKPIKDTKVFKSPKSTQKHPKSRYVDSFSYISLS